MASTTKNISVLEIGKMFLCVQNKKYLGTINAPLQSLTQVSGFFSSGHNLHKIKPAKTYSSFFLMTPTISYTGLKPNFPFFLRVISLDEHCKLFYIVPLKILKWHWWISLRNFKLHYLHNLSDADREISSNKQFSDILILDLL